MNSVNSSFNSPIQNAGKIGQLHEVFSGLTRRMNQVANAAKDRLQKIQEPNFSWKKVAKYGAIVAGVGIGATLLFLALRQGKGSPSLITEVTVRNIASETFPISVAISQHPQSVCLPWEHFSQLLATSSFPTRDTDRNRENILPSPTLSLKPLTQPICSLTERPTNENLTNDTCPLNKGTNFTNVTLPASSATNMPSNTTQNVYRVLTVDGVSLGLLVSIITTLSLQWVQEFKKLGCIVPPLFP